MKTLKIIGALATIASVPGCIVGVESNSPLAMVFGACLFFGGLVLFVAARLSGDV